MRVCICFSVCVCATCKHRQFPRESWFNLRIGLFVGGMLLGNNKLIDCGRGKERREFFDGIQKEQSRKLTLPYAAPYN